MNSHDIPQNICSKCRETIDVATHMGPDERAPQENDISICWFCGHVTLWRADRTLREMTEEERRAILRDPDVAKVLGSILADISTLTE